MSNSESASSAVAPVPFPRPFFYFFTLLSFVYRRTLYLSSIAVRIAVHYCRVVLPGRPSRRSPTYSEPREKIGKQTKKGFTTPAMEVALHLWKHHALAVPAHAPHSQVVQQNAQGPTDSLPQIACVRQGGEGLCSARPAFHSRRLCPQHASTWLLDREPRRRLA